MHRIKSTDELLDESLLAEHAYSPEPLRRLLQTAVSSNAEVYVTGTIGNRIAFVDTAGVGTLISPYCAIGQHPIYRTYQGQIHVESPGARISQYVCCGLDVGQLQSPRVRLVVLCNPTIFPYPRFSLGAAVLAAAIREKLAGNVGITDMQFGKTVDDVVNEIADERPDIVGISGTFGQYELLCNLINGIQSIANYTPMIVAGGSLSSLVQEELLHRFPKSIVATGPGEATVQDLIRLWRGDLEIEQVSGIAYLTEQGLRRTEPADASRVLVPELDTLPQTLAHRGIMLLETSRGCYSACSFCPRSHKGAWRGNCDEAKLESIMPFLAFEFDRHPTRARRVFLVDEEFIGAEEQNDLATARALRIAEVFQHNRFSFESSCRVDHVWNWRRNERWHVQRIEWWRNLARNGLSRMLFGVESGVDTVLQRFNKGITSEQIVYAIRTLSALGVPARFTYITFDPLMSMDELIATYRFQGRTDLLLRQMPDLSEEQLFAAVQDQDFCEKNTAGQPLYHEISYMLVSLEPLIGSRYALTLERLGLVSGTNLSMGRRDAVYADPVIGMLSQQSQLWIDRSFALDYALKSIAKLYPKDVNVAIREMRAKLKDTSYELMGSLLSIVTGDLSLMEHSPKQADLVSSLANQWKSAEGSAECRAGILRQALDHHLSQLRLEVGVATANLADHVSESDTQRIGVVLRGWEECQEWRLIN